ncbi:MAG: TIGR00282 family metallophosphoesterase [Verrucomicrobiaceae bacterium]|nr:MAG: TIGR00282 family metallophosphoesterase [Verrucomicrobiaceae bacterium]
MIRLLFLGDIVGEPGRKAVTQAVPVFLKERGVDFVVVNGENAAGGRGITGKIAIDLLRSGVAVITTGDHVWDQKETAGYISTEPRLLRPINYPEHAPGQGSVVLDTSKGKIAVMNVQCRTFMQPALDNPFQAAAAEVERLRQDTPVIFVDVHGETTSEKIAMGRFLDGRVSAVVGTHTHVQTADEQVLPGGTAFLCDAGMCGPSDSILGREPGPIIQRFTDCMPVSFPVARGPVYICGAMIEIDPANGRAESIQRIRELVH